MLHLVKSLGYTVYTVKNDAMTTYVFNINSTLSYTDATEMTYTATVR